MKKIIIVLLIIIYTLSIVGCTKENRVIERIDGSLKTYYKLEDGTWACDDHIYQYQLVILYLYILVIFRIFLLNKHGKQLD